MADLSALYPQPPAQQQQPNALLSDPAKAIGLLSGLQDYKLKQQQFDALAQQPAAVLQGQNIQNATAQIQQQALAARVVHGIMGNYLAGIKDPTDADVHGAAALAARSAPDIAVKYPDVITAASDVVRSNPRGIKYGAGLLLNSQLSPETASSLVEGSPNPATGAPRKVTVPESNLVGGRDVDLPPGEKGLLEAPTVRADRLQSTAATSPQYHADLENLKLDSKVLDNLGGPTFETEKKLNQLASRVGGFGITMTPDQLRAGESFDKIANQISLNQSQFFHGSDAGLHTVVGANPSSSMSKFGREGVIDMLQGNQDAIDVTRKAWLKARALGAPASSYDLFAEQMGEKIDPRVFQFNRLNRDNQQKFLSQMDPADIPDFERRYQEAVKQKWVKPLKAPAENGK